mgnify:FL=1
MDYFGRVMELFVTVVLLFMVPLNYMSARNELLCQNYVTTETTYFVDSVRNIGFVNKQMYETFVKKLAKTNVPYEVKMVHYKVKLTESEEADESEGIFLPYYHGIYHEDIMTEILASEAYYFYKGDFFSVSVEKKGFTWGDRLESFLIGRNLTNEELQVVYGGSIRDECE